MLFEKINSIKYRKYTSDITKVIRHIDLTKERAEEVNKVIAVANKGNKNFKLNNTLLFNIAIKKLFKDLEKLPSEKAIQILRKETLVEMGIQSDSLTGVDEIE